PGRTGRTRAPTASARRAPSAPTRWGKRYSGGSPRTTKRSRWFSAAARSAIRTCRASRGPAGSGTSAISSWSRPPVPRITQARMAGALLLRHERGGHHLLGAGGRDGHGGPAPGRPDRLHIDPEHVLLHRDDEPQEITGRRHREVRDHEVRPRERGHLPAGEVGLHDLRDRTAAFLLVHQIGERPVTQEAGRGLLALRAPREGTLARAVFRHQPDMVGAVAVRHEGDRLPVRRYGRL